MTGPSQSPRDRALWILANSGGKDGAEQIEEMHSDEVCSIRYHPRRAGLGRQDRDIRPGDSNTVNYLIKCAHPVPLHTEHLFLDIDP